VTFKGILNGLKLADAFDVVVSLVKVVSNYLTTAIHSLNDAIQILQDILTGGLKLWDNFAAFVKRVGAGTLLLMGFDEGSLLVGGIIRRGLDLSDEALRVVDNIGDDLATVGIKLNDDAENGVGILAKNIDPEEALSFSDELLSLCGAVGYSRSAAKLARPTSASASSDCVNRVIKIIGEMDDVAQQGLNKICSNISGQNAAELVARHTDDPEGLKGMFRIVGESSETYWNPRYVEGLERIVFSSAGLSPDTIKYLPINTLDDRLYPDFSEFLSNSEYLQVYRNDMNFYASRGYQDELLGHIRNLQGEYREARFHLFATNDSQDFLFRHTGSINEAGIDAITQKGNKYYWVDVKDKSQGDGLILTGYTGGSHPLGVADLDNYIISQNRTYSFNRDYFDNEVLRLLDADEISIDQFNALILALDEGRLEVMIFAGGSIMPFNNTLWSLDALIDPISEILIPFTPIRDRIY
jgi:hypothetical protein